MVELAGVLGGAVLALTVVALHYAKGTGWEASEDISQEVLEQRAASVPETDFPEPYNRSIGGGGAAAIPAGGSEGELAEGEEGEAEEEEEGFDPDAIADDEVEYYEVEFAKEGETIEVANNEPLLEAGEDEGWDLPYACREGQCISCAGHIEDGPAEDYIRHSSNESLFEDDMEDGYCLTCVAYPVDDFTLETSESP
ncbi:2Fe-2S iron-sulfur cluster-binding protein [Haloarcula nitratireducens]|uniref:2Fe-2S iron-sulfur cluster binding domain-containing protein n=1 Tax=Haloarcula nitratireducens TaxID=2487749 RepID=A0AAW4PC91_9EURY|nr:2Fe-2S iron-sulfur cluster-binding protein [Halomicroarcula nitratireducens]MBX0295531.1 2Fe-2S iron-sulfur cluster binding domain-containing protein [Halomicroarcula nitratireducens]